MKLAKLGKLFLFLILTYAMLMSVNIPRTSTIDTTTLSDIRISARTNSGDLLIHKYWSDPEYSQYPSLATRDEIQMEKPVKHTVFHKFQG